MFQPSLNVAKPIANLSSINETINSILTVEPYTYLFFNSTVLVTDLSAYSTYHQISHSSSLYPWNLKAVMNSQQNSYGYKQGYPYVFKFS